MAGELLTTFSTAAGALGIGASRRLVGFVLTPDGTNPAKVEMKVGGSSGPVAVTLAAPAAVASAHWLPGFVFFESDPYVDGLDAGEALTLFWG